MLFPRHPKPVVDGRAIAVLVVQQKVSRTPCPPLLVAAPASAPRPAVAPDAERAG